MTILREPGGNGSRPVSMTTTRARRASRPTEVECP